MPGVKDLNRRSLPTLSPSRIMPSHPPAIPDWRGLQRFTLDWRRVTADLMWHRRLSAVSDLGDFADPSYPSLGVPSHPRSSQFGVGLSNEAARRKTAALQAVIVSERRSWEPNDPNCEASTPRLNALTATAGCWLSKIVRLQASSRRDGNNRLYHLFAFMSSKIVEERALNIRHFLGLQRRWLFGATVDATSLFPDRPPLQDTERLPASR
jgi:hypothetical protein